MKIELFKRKAQRWYTPLQRLQRLAELVIKYLMLLAVPMPVAAAVVAVWYFLIFRRHLHFDEHMENIICAAWVPTFGILYSLLAATVFNTVWGEYKAMRAAVKRYDLDAFLDLRDEKVSPLVTLMMGVFSSSILLAFMSLKYPSVICGVMLISSTTYLFTLMFLVVREIDDPCSGIWFIRSIPDEWLRIDILKWRAQRHKEERAKYQDRLKIDGIIVSSKVEIETTASRQS